MIGSLADRNSMMPNPSLAQRYAEWAAAEAAVIEAQNDPGGVDAEALAALKARSGSLWVALWSEQDESAASDPPPQ